MMAGKTLEEHSREQGELMDRRFDAMDERFNRMEHQLGAVSRDLATILAKLGDFGSALAQLQAR